MYELTKYRNDLPSWFTLLTGFTPILEQHRLLSDLEDLSKKNILINAGRGQGKSLISAVIALWYIFVLSKTEKRPMKVYIISGSQFQSDILFGHARRMIEKHKFLYSELRTKGKLRETPKRKVELKDGSLIQSLPPTSTKIRSVHGDLLIVDECCEEKADKAIPISLSIPITSPTPRWIYTSTPHGRADLTFKKYIEKRKEYGMHYYHWNLNDLTWLSEKDKEQIIKKHGGKDSSLAKVELFAETKVTIKTFTFDVKDIRKSLRRQKALPEGGEIIMGIDWAVKQTQSKIAVVIIEALPGKTKVIFSKIWLPKAKFPEFFEELGKYIRDYKVQKIYYDPYPGGLKENLERISPSYVKIKEVYMKNKKAMCIGQLRRKFERGQIEIYQHDFAPRLIEDLRKHYPALRIGDDLVDALSLACYQEPRFDIPEAERKDLYDLTPFKELIREKPRRKGMKSLRRLERKVTPTKWYPSQEKSEKKIIQAIKRKKDSN